MYPGILPTRQQYLGAEELSENESLCPRVLGTGKWFWDRRDEEEHERKMDEWMVMVDEEMFHSSTLRIISQNKTSKAKETAWEKTSCPAPSLQLHLWCLYSANLNCDLHLRPYFVNQHLRILSDRFTCTLFTFICSWLTWVEHLSLLRCSSVHHGYKEWLFELH